MSRSGKARTVVITLEVYTDLTIASIDSLQWWRDRFAHLRARLWTSTFVIERASARLKEKYHVGEAEAGPDTGVDGPIRVDGGAGPVGG